MRTMLPFQTLGMSWAPPDSWSSTQEVGLVDPRPWEPAQSTRNLPRALVTIPGEGPASIMAVPTHSLRAQTGPCLGGSSLRSWALGTHSGCAQPRPRSASETGWASVPPPPPPGNAAGAGF